MIRFKILVNQLHIYDLILHQLCFGTVVIEFRFTKDVVILALMPCNFGKGKELILRHQRFVLGGDDFIELVQGDNAVQICGSIKIFP